MEFDYDEEVDVLYVSFDKPEPSIGIELDIPDTWAVGFYESEFGRPTGVTFIAFKELLLKKIEEKLKERTQSKGK